MLKYDSRTGIVNRQHFDAVHLSREILFAPRGHTNSEGDGKIARACVRETAASQVLSGLEYDPAGMNSIWETLETSPLDYGFRGALEQFKNFTTS